ncbi:MAG: 30S ribosomal protein S27ae [Candidatus Aenigmarchaeota archaeon]|nr:30S ribosomal protein S27ae [Candidatus Aenigmarchaeota archaeon]
MAEGKKPHSKSKHKIVQLWKKYSGGKRTGKFCPRCGAGTFMAEHKNRTHCGKCHYSEIKK